MKDRMTIEEPGPNQDESEGTPYVRQEEIEANIRTELEALRAEHEGWAVASGERLEDFDIFMQSRLESAIAHYQHGRAREELDAGLVRWDRVPSDACDMFEKLLEDTPTEAAAQKFLEDHPEFLVQTLGGGHGRFQKAQVRLGKEYVADFIVAEEHSMGVEWYLVELESPVMRVARKDGAFTAALNHAIDQIKDWRAWLSHNADYARRPEAQDGLGLIGIDSRAKGLVVAGRRQDYPPRYDEFRRQTRNDQQISIHSYDWLMEAGRSNLSGNLSFELRANN